MSAWNLQEALDGCNQPRYQDRIIARMWVYHRDMEVAGKEYARQKTDFERELGKEVVRLRSAGERSADVAGQKALSESDDLYFSKVNYRAAEQRVTADREALKILHAQLDDLRTQAADARKADEFQARAA
jgi:hypothetical protein